MNKYSKSDSKLTNYKWQLNERKSRVRHSQKRGYLTRLEHDVVEALFEVIIPSDKEPGAKEAGATEFLDNLLSQSTMYFEIPHWRKKWRTGITKLEDVTLRIYNSSFSSLSLHDRTDIVLKLSQGTLATWNNSKNLKLDQKDFFKMIRLHAIQGFLSDPRHGGNKNKIGWKFIGFEG